MINGFLEFKLFEPRELHEATKSCKEKKLAVSSKVGLN